jgi:hypothetical protein
VHSELFQKWVTIQGASSIASVTQDDEEWRDVSGLSDALFWIDAREVTSSGAQVFLTIQSSPTRDEALFVAVAPPVLLAASTTPIITKTARGAASLAPMGRWLRWQLTVVGSPTASWNAHFRIRMSRARSAFFTPPQLQGCLLWLRSDLGVPAGTVSSFAANSVWADQSGYSNSAVATSVGAGGSIPYSPNGGVNNLPSVNNSFNVSPNQAFFNNVALNGPFGSSHSLFVVADYQTAASQCCAFAATNAALTIDTAFAQFTEATSQNPAGRVSLNGTNSDASNNSMPSGYVQLYATWGNSTEITIWVNGVFTNQNSVSFTPGTPGGYVVLAQSGAGANPLLVSLYEVVVFNRVLSSNEFIIMNRYLGGRYGIAVP